MAIAFDAAVDGGAATSWSHTCTGANGLLLVGLVGDSGGADNVTGVTYNGVALTQLVKVQTPSNRFVYLYGLLGPATGSHTVAVSGSAVNTSGASASYTGVSQTGLPDASVTNTGSGASLTTSLTTVTNLDWTVIFGHSSGSGPSASTGVTQRIFNATVGGLLGDSNGPITPAGSTSLTVTQSGNIGVVMVAIAPSGAAPASTGNMFDVF